MRFAVSELKEFCSVMVAKENQKDYSLAAFSKLSSKEQQKYLFLARQRNPEFVTNERIIEVIAANIWLEEMREKGGEGKMKVLTKTLLLVDDEQEIREFLGGIIEQRSDFGVMPVSSGEQAIVAYKENQPDCVLLDLCLPDIDGLKVLAEIKAFDPQAKVCIVSGTDSRALRLVAKELGALAYITKPVSLEKVMSILRQI